LGVIVSEINQVAVANKRNERPVSSFVFGQPTVSIIGKFEGLEEETGGEEQHLLKNRKISNKRVQ